MRTYIPNKHSITEDAGETTIPPNDMFRLQIFEERSKNI